MNWKVTPIDTPTLELAERLFDLSRLTLGNLVCDETPESVRRILGACDCYQFVSGEKIAAAGFFRRSYKNQGGDDRNGWTLLHFLFDPVDAESLVAPLADLIASLTREHAPVHTHLYWHPSWQRLCVFPDAVAVLRNNPALLVAEEEEAGGVVWEVSCRT